MPQWKNRRLRKRRISFSSRIPDSVKRSRVMFALAKYGFIGVLVLFIGFFIAIPILAVNLPSPDKVVRREGFASKIYDRNGVALYDIYNDERRNPISQEDIPQDLKDAVIAIEDKNFYSHQGFDPLGLVRGLSRYFTRGRAQGGSTLTQQLVKNVLLSSERSVVRKIKEFVLAVQIERKYSKDEILQMYLNEAPYGGTLWGVGSAAETYFGKSVRELTLLESAILAGLPQRPSVYSPYSSTPDAYIDRTKQVLRRMREDGHISEDEEKEAVEKLENVEFQDQSATFKAPHFVQYVQKRLEDRYGERVIEQGGLKITTTLDSELQETAQTIVAEEIEKVERFKISNGAAVILDSKTGEILAMIGSKNFNDPDYDGQFNVAADGIRQPGSSIKPITYAAAFKKGYTPSTLLMDVATEFPGGAGQPPYKPVNYDGTYRGPVQVRYALGNSLNVPAVKMLAMVGVKDMLETAYDLGINTLEPTKENLARFGLAVTLGGGEVKLVELTDAYASFMNGGFNVEPVAILKIEDSNGKLLEEFKPKQGRRVLSPEHAFLVADILSDNEARKDTFGLNSQLVIPGRQVAVKTGTTNERKDNWTIGGNPQVTVGVWVGNNDNTSMTQVASGVTGASPIWRRVIMAALDGKPNVSFETPGGIVTSAVDTISGYAAHDGFPSRIEKFVSGTVPGDDPVHKKLKICKNDGKLATPSDIAGGNFDEKEFVIFKEEDPTAAAGGPNKWQEAINAWVAAQNNPLYISPTEYCGTSNPLNIDFVTPHDRDSNLPNKFMVEFRGSSTSDIKEMRLEADGQKVRTFSSQPYKHEIELSNGVHELRVVGKDADGHESDRKITIGVNTSWDANQATPTPSPTPTPTPTTVLPTIEL